MVIKKFKKSLGTLRLKCASYLMLLMVMTQIIYIIVLAVKALNSIKNANKLWVFMHIAISYWY